MNEQFPRIGVGVYVIKNGKVLLGRRKNSHGAGTWSSPGGKLELKETPLDCGVRETLEEAGVEVQNVRFLGFTNDLDTEDNTHWITLAYSADWKAGEARIMEPDKCSEWSWFAWDNLPEPLYLSTRNFVNSAYNPFNEI